MHNGNLLGIKTTTPRRDGDFNLVTTNGYTLTLSGKAVAVAGAVGSDAAVDIDKCVAKLVALPIRDDDGKAAVAAEFLAECLDGAEEEPDLIAPWTEYAGEITSAAEDQLPELPTGTLRDYRTGAAIRPATLAEIDASREADKYDGGRGVIDVNGVACYVEE